MRTKSIKSKIMIVFSVTFLLMQVSLVLVNHFFMDDFYKASNRTKMTEVAVEFERFSRENNQKRAFGMLRNSGLLVALFNEGYNLLPGSLNDIELVDLLQSDIRELRAKTEKNGGIYFDVIVDSRSNDNLLVLTKILDHGDILLLSKKMALADEVSLLNFRFMLITSGFIYGIALILIYIISSKFSKPIIDIMYKTERMSQLDFSQKIDVWSSDEIGVLSGSINKLSDELSSSICELNDSNRKLSIELEKEKKLEKMRRRFVSDVSHELKNPISMILGYADGLIHNIPKTEKDKAYYHQVIVEESLKMNTLIKDLLDLSSYESGSFTLNKEMVDFNQIVENCLKKYSNQIIEKGINVEIQNQDRYMVLGDRLRLEQVVVNLVTNALKYVNEEGTVIIKYRKDTDKLSLTIANTGTLIPQKELEQIWNSFYQIDNTKKGSGLGLAIVKSIISLHEGSCLAYTDGIYNCFEIII